MLRWRIIFLVSLAVAVSYLDRQTLPVAIKAIEQDIPISNQQFALFKIRETWGLLIAKFLSDGAWYFYLFWLPKYLYDARGLEIKTVGSFVWMPPVAAGVGSFFGGWFASWLLHRNLSLNAGRKIAMLTSALVMPAMLFVPAAPLAWAMAFFCVAYFGHQFWATIIMTLPADLYPKSTVGAIAGLMGCAGGFGGVAFGQLFGWLLDHGPGWFGVFAIAGSLHVISFGVVCAFLPRLLPVALPSRSKVS